MAKGYGRAVAYGAVTIVNAIACGYGAALGVDLWTEATVELTDNPNVVEGKIVNDPSESTRLIEKTVKRILRYFRLEDKFGAYVETRSNIPIARGLKSSSVAANAISLATLSALDRTLDDLTVVKLGVEASIDAGVTVTGAFDDASASYFGNITVTDNLKRRILKTFKPEIKNVLIYVPEEKYYTVDSDVSKMRVFEKEVKAIHRLALEGDYWTAMTLNGILYSSILGFSPEVAISAIENGAVAAGLSGKGPAVAAVVSDRDLARVERAWSELEGRVIRAKINRRKAQILE
ncbi:shikimate kinase [Candidatus Bathyarchaeota archaeon]|nr:shikimate kinase [Candidatus Bathyarchaeota archaeon]RJS82853.1 MAG: shikimate kinase [Candidatus Bathyarchaeota archaeon]RLI23034.1 MAG: shikimate kinase [Candidatus Bathyarchaeota archaeon]